MGGDGLWADGEFIFAIILHIQCRPPRCATAPLPHPQDLVSPSVRLSVCACGGQSLSRCQRRYQRRCQRRCQSSFQSAPHTLGQCRCLW